MGYDANLLNGTTICRVFGVKVITGDRRCTLLCFAAIQCLVGTTDK